MDLSPDIIHLVKTSLHEDLGEIGDITSRSTIDASTQIKAVMRSRESGIVAGVELAEFVFKEVDETLILTKQIKDGETLQENQPVLTIKGNAQSILKAERVALNFISHLSGIATKTAKYVDAVKDTKAKILDTRKTLPGYRTLHKYAVKIGGGTNHRFGLYDMILIKDNHIAGAGGIKPALNLAQKSDHNVKIEIEVDTLDQLQEVLSHGGADIVLLDNMTPEQLKQAVGIIDGRLITEASGGINLKTVRAIAESGVDFISIGALTHSVKALDIGLDIGLDIKGV